VWDDRFVRDQSASEAKEWIDVAHEIESLIGKRFSAFLRHKPGIRNGLIAVVSEVRKLRLEGFVFGGVIRDIWFKGPRAFPRDVDLVFERSSFEKFQHVFAPWIVHRNRFGGLYLRIGWVDFDVWPLDETWAFKNCANITPSFRNLPDTTFLSIDAIAIELSPPNGRFRRIYENRFFDSITTQTIDLNFSNNPFPALSILRTLVLSHRLQYRLTDRLAEYIFREFPKIGLKALEDACLKHYERHVISWEMMELVFGRAYKGPSDFNRAWAELNAGFYRQESFESAADWLLKENHLFVDQLLLPGLCEGKKMGVESDSMNMDSSFNVDGNRIPQSFDYS
jgi:hypothetical protein